MKKTMFKRIFAGIAAVFTLGLCVPTGFTGTDFKPSFETVAESGSGWTLEKNGLLTVSNGAVIENYQFVGNNEIKEVTIGDNCTVGEAVFWDCTSLTSVTIGNNCTIKSMAFLECNSIQKVICIGDKNTVTVDDHNPEIICNKDKWLTEGGWTLDEKGVLTVKNNTTIDERQFNYDSSIKKVIIGDNCNIGEEAFYRCTALTSVTIGNGCKLADFINEGNENLGNSAFWECTSLTSVKIGDGCDIGRRSFEDCATLTDVTIGNSCTVNTYAFLNCTSLTNVAFGYSCTIGRWAFDYCNSIQKVSCKGDKNTVTVDDYNPEIIRNKGKWTIITGTLCPKCYGNAIDFKCESCGYFDKAAVEAEIKANEERNAYLKSLLNEQETQSENESDNNTASTISTGNPLILLFGGIAVIIGSVAAAIILKRMKKAE